MQHTQFAKRMRNSSCSEVAANSKTKAGTSRQLQQLRLPEAVQLKIGDYFSSFQDITDIIESSSNSISGSTIFLLPELVTDNLHGHRLLALAEEAVDVFRKNRRMDVRTSDYGVHSTFREIEQMLSERKGLMALRKQLFTASISTLSSSWPSILTCVGISASSGEMPSSR